MRRTKTETIIAAMRALADELDDEMISGAADAIREAADGLAELNTTAIRQCVWTRDADYGDVYDGACGVKWEFTDGGPRENEANYCPRCGGRVKVARRPTAPFRSNP